MYIVYYMLSAARRRIFPTRVFKHPFPPKPMLPRRTPLVPPPCAFVPLNPDYMPLYYIGSIVVLYSVGMYLMNSQRRNISQFTQTIAKKPQDVSSVRFDDVAGIENAKHDLYDIIDFLNHSEMYTKMGARIPKGVLLVGPPGTGKTLLSRAVAGEAKVPFFSCSGSEFIELFVGAGAARIRELFKKAKEAAPCIIFIDEIDAIGKKRGASPVASNDERDQTLNQLLTEMDGFEQNKGIIIMAATNRAELLDDALLRPGRFDRKVYVDLPNLAARQDILDLHMKNKPTQAIDISKLAKLTMGFSGAELENLCNEVAIYAARNKYDTITQDMFDHIYDKLTLGPESKTNRITQNKQKILAYHEAGHALAGVLLGEFDTLRKVSIVARGNAGGITYFEPTEERHTDIGLYTRKYLYNQLIVLLSGRAAEEITFGTTQITTGASNDIERATNLATQMVSKYGFNETIGPLNTEANNLYDKDVASEIKFTLEKAYHDACNLLRHNEHYLISIAMQLMEKETLDGNDILTIISGLECSILSSAQI